MMKKLLRYWSPAILWLGFIFILANRSLGGPSAWQAFYAIMLKLFPGASYNELSAAYVAFRKIWHFIEYAILAILIYRALRAGRPPLWHKPKVLWAGLGAFSLGFLDEFVQSFVPGRSGNPFDWAIDTAGIMTGLAVLALWARRKGSASDAASGHKNTPAGLDGSSGT